MATKKGMCPVGAQGRCVKQTKEQKNAATLSWINFVKKKRPVPTFLPPESNKKNLALPSLLPHTTGPNATNQQR